MRCKMCDRSLKSSEVIWYPEEKRHEELCCKCRSIISDDMRGAGWDDTHIPVEDIVAPSEAIPNECTDNFPTINRYGDIK